MKGNSLYYLIIAGMLAIIGFLIYFFFKKNSENDQILPVLNPNKNPINPHSVNNIDTPVLYMPDGDKPYSGGSVTTTAIFKPTQYEDLKKDGKALTQRTNNPGAIFWDGVTAWQGLDKTKTKSGGIITFTNIDYGIRSQCMTLRSYSTKHGIDTLNKLTARYAPLGHGDNNPVAYAKNLSMYLGIEPNDKFDMANNRNVLAGIAYFIHRVEAGYFWVPRTKFIEWADKI